MTLQTDLETAVTDVQADSQKLKDIVNGPASGAASMVTVDSGDVKTVARAIAEVGDTSNQAIKDLRNVTDADFLSKANRAGVAGMKVSGDDTTAGDLEAKLLTDTSLNATTQNGGANETRTLAVRAKSGGGIVIDADGVSVDRSFTKDQEARDLAIAAYIKADIAALDPAGAYGDIVSDNFVADTLATRTNAAYDAAGDFYTNHGGYSSDLASGKTITSSAAVSGYPAVQAVDGNSATKWYGSSTVRGASESLTIDLGSGSETEIRQITFKYSRDGGFSESHWPNSWKVYYSDDNASFVLAETVSGLAQDATLQIKQISAHGAHRYWRIENADSARYPSLDELQMMSILPPSDMTLRPDATTLPTANPLDLCMYFRVRDIEAVTEGVDRVIKASIDGGTTWATATITQVGTFGNTDKLIRADADVSAQTGDQFVWELATANAKEQQVKQVASLAGY